MIRGPVSIILLGVTLIAYGLSGLGVPLGIIPPILALVTGVLLLIGR